MTDNIILFIIMYASGAYWRFRRYPNSKFHYGIKLFLILVFIVPMIFFFMALRLSRREMRAKILSILKVNSLDVVRVALANLAMILTLLTTYGMFNLYNAAFKYIEIRLFLSCIIFMGIIELFIRYERKNFS